MITDFLNTNSVCIFTIGESCTRFCRAFQNANLEVPEVFFYRDTTKQPDAYCRPLYNALRHAISSQWRYITVFNGDVVPCTDIMTRYADQFRKLPNDWDMVCYYRSGDCSKYESYESFKEDENADWLNCSDNVDVNPCFMKIPRNAFGEYEAFTVRTEVFPLVIEASFYSFKGFMPTVGMKTYNKYFTKRLYFMKNLPDRGFVYPLNYTNDKINSGMSSGIRDSDAWQKCPDDFFYTI